MEKFEQEEWCKKCKAWVREKTDLGAMFLSLTHDRGGGRRGLARHEGGPGSGDNEKTRQQH